MPRRVGLAAALVAAVALQAAAVLVTARYADTSLPLALIHPGADGPSAAVVAADFDEPLPDGIGHDGQQNYAIARDPWHPRDVAEHLDRPIYRLQRPLLPLLGWLLHPTGGGPGLVWAMFAVNVAALAALGAAVARLARRVAAPWWLGALVALLPLAYFPLRITTADVLALALALWALDGILGGRDRRAAVLGTLAVLAKESSLVVLAGGWLARRDRRAVPGVLVPAAVGGALAVALRLGIEERTPSVGELGPPFRGLWDSFDLLWLHGEDLEAAVSVLGGLLLGALVLATPAGRASPLAPAIALQLAFTVLLDVAVLGLQGNGTRTTAALQVLALLAAASEPVRRGRVPAGAGGEPDGGALRPPSAAPASGR